MIYGRSKDREHVPVITFSPVNRLARSTIEYDPVHARNVPQFVQTFDGDHPSHRCRGLHVEQIRQAVAVWQFVHGNRLTQTQSHGPREQSNTRRGLEHLRHPAPDATVHLNDDWTGRCEFCLLYTSDAADEEDSVDLGG